MEKLSLKSYVWKCVLGTEVAYFACLVYGVLLPQSSTQLHNALFELLPGFAWGVIGVIVGAVDLFVFAWIFGSYMVWMHNSSLRNI